jgi:hypothetical protein
MPRRTAIGDEWEDDPDDEFDGDSDDSDDDVEGDSDDDESETVPCPYCKRPIHEDAERCPYCESYISREDAPPSRKPWWILLGVGLCLFAVYRWIVG